MRRFEFEFCHGARLESDLKVTDDENVAICLARSLNRTCVNTVLSSLGICDVRSSSTLLVVTIEFDFETRGQVLGNGHFFGYTTRSH